MIAGQDGGRATASGERRAGRMARRKSAGGKARGEIDI
jgi:hypothetical protein